MNRRTSSRLAEFVPAIDWLCSYQPEWLRGDLVAGIRHQGNQQVPGVFIFRCDGGIFYFNAEHVSDRFFDLLEKRGDMVKLAIFLTGTVPLLDMAGVVTGASDSTRAARIDTAVGQALAPFFD